MTEAEQQIQNYAAEVEKLRTERIQLTERLRHATERNSKFEVTVQVMEAFIDRLLDRIADN